MVGFEMRILPKIRALNE
jgi:pre-mRNA-processing factor 8